MNYKFFEVNTDVGILYYLDIGKVSDSEYDFLKPIIEHLGGHWRERVHCFVFGENKKSEIDYYIQNGVTISEQYRWQEETQFYPTPKKLAKRVVELAGICKNDSVLEPSAGRGNLLEPIDVNCNIVCIEPLKENFNILQSKGFYCEQCFFEDAYSEFFVGKGKYNFTYEDYLRGHKKSLIQFDKVIMNPPFSGQRDIRHVMMAYSLLRTGGSLVAIISENALYYKTKCSSNFKRFLKRHNAYIEPVPFRSFVESGTTIETVIIKLVK